MTAKAVFGGILRALVGKVFEAYGTQYVTKDETPPGFWEAVKLIHADDLTAWTTFKAYEQHRAITYAEYREGRHQLQAWRRDVETLLAARKRLADLDVDTLEQYDIIDVAVPASLLRKQMEISLPEPPHHETTMSSDSGEVRDGKLIVHGTWRSRTAPVQRSCPARVLHAEEIATLRRQIAEMTPGDRKTLQRVDDSPFAHPVLFISHRWESVEHPDQEGRQLVKLQALRNCFVIYDYSSFPQDTVTEESKAALTVVLTHMNRLIERVVVLQSPEYVDRGWCIYEYILASLKMSIVCDEINDPVFVSLRNLMATEAPPVPGESVFRPSMQSEIQNRINEDILKTVNYLLPRFQQSRFTVEADRGVVSELLLTQLLAVLPSRKEHVTYSGEWTSKPWTREDLQQAFQQELSWEPLQVSHWFHAYQLRVPATIAAAVNTNYELDSAPPINAGTWLERLLG